MLKRLLILFIICQLFIFLSGCYIGDIKKSTNLLKQNYRKDPKSSIILIPIFGTPLLALSAVSDIVDTFLLNGFYGPYEETINPFRNKGIRYYHKAISSLQQGKRNEAHEFFVKAISYKKEIIELLGKNELFLFCRDSCSFQEKELCSELCIKSSEKNHGGALYYLGNIYEKKQDYNNAFHLYKKSYEVGGNHNFSRATSADRIAWIYRFVYQNRIKAFKWSQKAFKLKPDYEYKNDSMYFIMKQEYYKTQSKILYNLKSYNNILDQYKYLQNYIAKNGVFAIPEDYHDAFKKIYFTSRDIILEELYTKCNEVWLLGEKCVTQVYAGKVLKNDIIYINDSKLRTLHTVDDLSKIRYSSDDKEAKGELFHNRSYINDSNISSSMLFTKYVPSSMAKNYFPTKYVDETEKWSGGIAGFIQDHPVASFVIAAGVASAYDSFNNNSNSNYSSNSSNHISNNKYNINERYTIQYDVDCPKNVGLFGRSATPSLQFCLQGDKNNCTYVSPDVFDKTNDGIIELYEGYYKIFLCWGAWAKWEEIGSINVGPNFKNSFFHNCR